MDDSRRKWGKLLSAMTAVLFLCTVAVVIFAPEPERTPEMAAQSTTLQKQEQEMAIVREQFIQTLLHTHDGNDILIMIVLLSVATAWGTVALFRRSA